MADAHGHRIEYINISKSYGAFQALRQTTLEIRAGEVFAIIGPSGSGKTTFLGLTAGYLQPSGGEIRIDGTNIETKLPFQRNIGMVFQGYSLFPHMTVAENIGFPLRVRKVPKPEVSSRVARMISLVRLDGMADRYPSALSGGQQQRVALARAAIYNPLLLVMDEPLSALDKNLRDEMQYEIKQFQKTFGSTLLYVTHDQGEAASLADRIAIMRDGAIEQIGSARELYDKPQNRFVASFLGHANIIDVTAMSIEGEKAKINTSFGNIFSTNRTVRDISEPCACIRPESIFISRNGNLQKDNIVPGTVLDATYLTGSVRYKLKIDSGPEILQIQQIQQGEEIISVGDNISIGWNSSDTMLIGK
jgi:putative spermidine/putrescine transport system ATP-binding protein